MVATPFRELAFYDFERAARQALWRTWLSWFTRQCNQLLAFDQLRACLAGKNQHARGLQIVPLDKIVGSAGRARDFDRAFFPRQWHTRERWISIAQAFYAQTPLPPVDLIKLGEEYFVTDGHHRVSVARTHGQAFIDANVTEIDVAEIDVAEID